MLTRLATFLVPLLAAGAPVPPAPPAPPLVDHELKTDADVRVYFIGEGAGYANSLGFTTDGSGSRIGRTITAPAPDDPQRAFLGISTDTATRALFPLRVTLGGVGGPSAGTMLALGIIDKLTPGQLNGGRFVAGTGTIDPQGNVGAIGGIEQKMVGARDSGATLFLAPASNCDDVSSGGVPSGLTVARVSTLSEAVTAIEAYVAGRSVVGCR